MKKVSSLLLLLFSLISFLDSVQAQTTTTIEDKVILKSYYDKSILLFHDYDNEDDLWFSLLDDTTTYIYQVDNNLNITKTIKNGLPNPYYFKLNNKLYGTGNHLRIQQDVGFIITDSIALYSDDSNGNNINYKWVFSCKEDTSKYNGINKCFFTKDHNIAILLRSQNKSDKNQFVKLMIFDTLGERIASKQYDNIIIPESCSYLPKIYETDSNYIMNHSNDVFGILKSTKAYYIDKNTLNIIDSNSYDSTFFISNQKKINDSIIITISSSGERPSSDPERYFINIVNDKKLKLEHRIKVEFGGEDIGYYIPDYQECVDYINQDSIYFCCFVDHNTGIYDNDYSGFIQIVNFGIDGDLNFDYRFRYDSLLSKQINGVKATADGGLLVAVQMYNDCWIMKFMPNGVVSLANVETGEKGSIKVYPNPARDYVNVDIECTNFKASDIDLFDMQGRIVKKAKLKAKQGNMIDVSSLNSGAYTYNVSLNGKTISGKIIVGK